MDVTSDNHCFVCGELNSAGLKARFEVDSEHPKATCTLALPASFQGWQGVVHGGILAALLDEACIYACRTLHEKVVTAELSLRYKKPVPVGTDLLIRAEVTEANKRTMSAKASLSIDGATYAEAVAKIFLVK